MIQTSSDQKPTVLLIGALPPPHIGPTLATEIILKSRLNETFEIIHLDTSDPRDLNTLTRFDLQNVWLALKSYLALVALLIRRRPRLVYLLTNQTTIGYLRDSIYILLARLFGCKVVGHLRGGNFRNWYEAAHPLMRWYVRRIQPLLHGQIVLGECLRGLYRGLMPEEHIFVVPNGKDIRITPKRARERSSRCHVMFLANMKEAKGVLDVLHAARIVHEKKMDAEFHFVGAWSDQSTREKIETFLASNQGLPIVWHGKRTGVAKARVFDNSDLFVFPTYYPAEGHPWVIVEAMAAGLPIIATDHAAIPESVLDGENGIIVEKRNPAMLAEAIMRLCKDARLRREMGARSRALYEERFTEARMIGGLEVVFKAVLAPAVSSNQCSSASSRKS